MRDVKLIQADIAKLQAELEDAKVYGAKRDSAVHILENLGWSYNCKLNKWKKPAEPSVKVKLYKSSVVAGVFATYNHEVLGGNVYVRSVNTYTGNARVSWVRGQATSGALIERTVFTVRIDELTVKPREYFISR